MGRDWKLLRKKFEDDQKIEKHSALDLMNEEMEETQKKDGQKWRNLKACWRRLKRKEETWNIWRK